MLIFTNPDDKNLKSISILQKNQSDIENESSYFVIDIKQELFKKTNTAQQYAQHLIDSGLSKAIKDIYILSSEIEEDHFMAVFAQNLSQFFAEYHQRNINVHIPSCLSYEITLIVPAEKENTWKIFGINRSDLTQTDHTYKKLLSEKNQKIVWQGDDLLKWMNDPQQTYSSRVYAWGQPTVGL